LLSRDLECYILECKKDWSSHTELKLKGIIFVAMIVRLCYICHAVL
jgi:hypothetical protein